MKRTVFGLGLLLLAVPSFAKASDDVEDMQRAQRHRTQLELQARQTQIMEEQLELQRRQIDDQQRARDDEMLRRHNAAVRSTQVQEAELDRELDRAVAEHLREKKRAEAAARAHAAPQREKLTPEPHARDEEVPNGDGANQQAVARSVAKAQAAYAFANEGDALFGEFESFLEAASKSPEYKDTMELSPNWPFIMATEFATQKGIARRAETKPEDQGRTFTAWSLDPGHRTPKAEIHNGRVFAPGQKMGAVADSYFRVVEPLPGGGVRVTDRPISARD